MRPAPPPWEGNHSPLRHYTGTLRASQSRNIFGQVSSFLTSGTHTTVNERTCICPSLQQVASANPATLRESERESMSRTRAGGGVSRGVPVPRRGRDKINN